MTEWQIAALLTLRNSLLEAASTIDKAVSIEHTEKPKEAAEPAPRRREWLWDKSIDWAQVGGRDFVPARAGLFETAEFASRYRPGESRSCYGAHCEGAGALAKAIGIPLLKVSTCATDRLKERITEAKADAYGSGYFSNGVLVNDESQWANWQTAFLRPQGTPSAGSPVTIGARTIDVILPENMSRHEFDRLFDLEIRKGAIDLWSLGQEGVAHCKARGIDPSMLRRWTVYSGHRDMAPTAVRELVVFRQRTDPDRIIAIMEKIILRHLCLVA